MFEENYYEISDVTILYQESNLRQIWSKLKSKIIINIYLFYKIGILYVPSKKKNYQHTL